MYLYISEFSRISFDFGNLVIQAPFASSLVAEQYLKIDFEPSYSEVFNSRSRFILVSADTNCCLAFGKEPNPRLHKLFAAQSRLYGIEPGTRLGVVKAES